MHFWDWHVAMIRLAHMNLNLYEYGLGGYPQAGTNHPREAPDFRWFEADGTAGLEVVHRRRRNAGPLGLWYRGETCADLTGGTWSTAGVAEAAATVEDDDFETVALRRAADTTTGFMRLDMGITDQEAE